MKQFNTLKDAMHTLERARRAMAFSKRDVFRIQNTEKRNGFVIAMYASNGEFCGYY